MIFDPENIDPIFSLIVRSLSWRIFLVGSGGGTSRGVALKSRMALARAVPHVFVLVGPADPAAQRHVKLAGIGGMQGKVGDGLADRQWSGRYIVQTLYRVKIGPVVVGAFVLIKINLPIL